MLLSVLLPVYCMILDKSLNLSVSLFALWAFDCLRFLFH